MKIALLSLIFQYSSMYGVPPELVHSIIQVESSWNTKAVGSVGEVGLMQIRPEYYPKYTKKQLFNPEINLQLGIKHLAEAIKQCKHQTDYTGVLCYNRGVAGGSKVAAPKQNTYYRKVMSVMPETRIKLAIIDTGIQITSGLKPYLCKDGSKDFTGHGLVDMVGHGTNIASIIVTGLSPATHCIMVLKFYHSEVSGNDPYNIIKAINYAIQQKASLINMSLSGSGKIFSEQIALQRALNNEIVVVVSAGNDEKDLSKDCYIYPACYKFSSPNFHVVGNWKSGSITKSNTGVPPITEVEDGVDVEAGGYIFSGTSQSAAKRSNYYAKQMVVKREPGK